MLFMPELPEVETIINDLKQSVIGATVVDFWENSPKQVVPSVGEVKESVIGSTIVGVERRGKLILIEMYNVKCKIYNYIGIHLKMSGRLLLRKKNDPPDRYAHAIFSLKKIPKQVWDDKWERELRFCDTRKFGYVKLFGDKKDLEKSVHQKLGPEPLSKDFTPEYLRQVLKHKNVSIKTTLLDQSLIAGIGNIYANEALFLASIRPTRKTKSLKFKEFKSLKESIIKVLKKGIKYRGSSSRDESYRDLYGNLGQYQNYFLVYEKKEKDCPNECGGVIEYSKVNGRGTFWCPLCQH